MATFLCLSSYFKGNEFLIACKEAGNTVYLVTSVNLKTKPWALTHVDEVFYIQQKEDDDWNYDDMVTGTAYLMRTHKIDRIVALDDFDVEKAAMLREIFRIPGMGQTTARHFRDKLAMRMKAADGNIRVPAFSNLFNDDDINDFLENVQPPWVVKPRGAASASGIVKCYTAAQAWDIFDSLGHERHNYLIEQFKPGEVFHVDTISDGGKIAFCQSSFYLNTPLEVAHEGGIFRSVTLEYDSADDKMLKNETEKLMDVFGMNFSAAHTEFIKCHEDGEFYFLETASRVGGANLSDMVYNATGINLWQEWANVENAAAKNIPYKTPKRKKLHAGIIVSLSRVKRADYKEFTAPEIQWKLHMDHHIGVIFQSKSRNRVLELLEEYTALIKSKYHASAPAESKPSH